MQTELKHATPDDFKRIEELAIEIWNKHYVPVIGQQQVDYMLSSIYNYESLLQQTEKKGHQFYLIRQQDDTIGFVSISEESPGNWWIHKFYILNSVQGKGIGADVFELLKQEIKDPATIRLTVNRQNYKSINFYFKLGFKIEEVADFNIGNGYFMNDFVMRWQGK